MNGYLNAPRGTMSPIRDGRVAEVPSVIRPFLMVAETGLEPATSGL